MFRFKQFDVHDESCAMKVGTDGVIIGAWADVKDDSYLLDAGTGSGLIAMMLAQRAETACITAIDVEPSAVEQARENILRTAWSDRIDVYCRDLREMYTEKLYDHIVSNPPFFVDAIPSPDAARSTARHTSSLSFSDIVDASVRLLRKGGRLSLILPVESAAMFRREAFGRLWLSRQTNVITCEGDTPKRTLLEFTMSDAPVMPRVDDITIQRRDGSYSEEYRLMTQDFYLKF